MSKKDFILALCQAIGKPVSLYSSHDGYTCLKLTDGQFVDVYCDRCKSTETCSLKLKFHLDTIGTPELKKAKRFVQDLKWNPRVDIYNSTSNCPWSRDSSVLRIRTCLYWPWQWPGDEFCKHYQGW